MKKKFLTTSLSAMISMGVLASNLSLIQAHNLPYTDVVDDWATPGIEYCYNTGVMTGKGLNTFDPDGNVNRAMMAVVLHRMLGAPAPASLTHFNDVDPMSYYAKAVNWLFEHQLINGYGDGRYGPLDNLTREQMAKMFFAYNESTKGKDVARADLSLYADAILISPAMQEPMSWAAARGIMTGSDGKLNPAGLSSRKMLATVIARYNQSSSGSQEQNPSGGNAPGTSTDPNQGQSGSENPGTSGGSQSPAEQPTSTSTTTSDGIKITQTTIAKAAAQEISRLRKSYPSGTRLMASFKTKPKEDFTAYKPVEIVMAPENYYVLQFTDNASAIQVMAAIQKTYGTNFVHLDTAADPNHTYTSWGPEYIHADKLKARIDSSQANSAKVVAMIDTGVNLNHELLAGRLLGGYDFANDDNEPLDINGHGSHTAGIVADTSYGTDVFILPVQVFAGDTDYAYEVTVAEGILYAIDQGADIINLSLGMKAHSQSIEAAVKQALDQGIIVITAAGNSSTDVATFCPAHMSEVITVGAVDDQSKLGWYSNTGKYVDLVAPGSSILSSWNNQDEGYHLLTGTSMAAPSVSAGAAMVLMLYPNLNCGSMEQVLSKACTDLGTKGWDPQYGYGLLNLANIQ